MFLTIVSVIGICILGGVLPWPFKVVLDDYTDHPPENNTYSGIGMYIADTC